MHRMRTEVNQRSVLVGEDLAEATSAGSQHGYYLEQGDLIPG